MRLFRKAVGVCPLCGAAESSCFDGVLWCAMLCCGMLCPAQADEELREGKLRFRGGREEGATYDEPDEVKECVCVFGGGGL